MHWVLDVAFHEDACRIRVGEAAQNFTILRRIALNLLKNETTTKLGVVNKRLRVGWNVDCLAKLFGHIAFLRLMCFHRLSNLMMPLHSTVARDGILIAPCHCGKLREQFLIYIFSSAYINALG